VHAHITQVSHKCSVSIRHQTRMVSLTWSVSKNGSSSLNPTTTKYWKPQSKLRMREGSIMVKKGRVSLEASEMLLDVMGVSTAMRGC
jgi:hypothetical protein